MKKKKSFKQRVDEVVPSKNLVELTIPRPDMSLALSAEPMLEAARKIKITNQAQYEDAAATLIKLSSKETEIDDQRTTLKKPINQAAAAVQALFRPALNFLEDAKTIIRQEMSDYHTRQAAERVAAKIKEAQLLDQAASTKRKSAKTELITQASYVASQAEKYEAPVASGISMVETWDWEIEDEEKIPRMYLVIDEVAVNAIVRAKKGDTKIPGIKVTSKKMPRVGGK